MERKASSLRFTRGRLAALLSAVVLVTIVVFSLTFYHLCLHAKRMEVLTQGDGPLWAFEQGQLDILSQEADGATVYGGSGCRVIVRNGEITAVTDENMGFSKFYEGGVLTSVTFDNPLAEAAALCTPFSVNSYVQYTVRTPEEARTIRAELDRGGTAALEARGLRCWALGNGYLVVETCQRTGGCVFLNLCGQPGGPLLGLPQNGLRVIAPDIQSLGSDAVGIGDPQHPGHPSDILISEIPILQRPAGGGNINQPLCPAQPPLLPRLCVSKCDPQCAGPLQIDLQRRRESQIPIGGSHHHQIRPGHLPGGEEQRVLPPLRGQLLPAPGQLRRHHGQLRPGQVPLRHLQPRAADPQFLQKCAAQLQRPGLSRPPHTAVNPQYLFHACPPFPRASAHFLSIMPLLSPGVNHALSFPCFFIDFSVFP